MAKDPINEAVEERLKRARLSESPQYLDTPVDGDLTMGLYLLPDLEKKAEELYAELIGRDYLSKAAGNLKNKQNVVRAIQSFIAFDILEDIKNNFYESDFWKHHVEKSKELVKR